MLKRAVSAAPHGVRHSVEHDRIQSVSLEDGSIGMCAAEVGKRLALVKRSLRNERYQHNLQRRYSLSQLANVAFVARLRLDQEVAS